MSFTSHFSSFKVDAEAAVVEFVGTTVFLLLGLGGIQVAKGDPTTDSGGSTIEQVLYISTCMGLSLLVSAWLFFRVTGGPFNPNITLALLLVGEIKPLQFVLFCIAQMLGAIAASGLLLALTPGPLSNGVNPAQGVFIEMFITTALVLAVLMLATEKHHATPFAPVGIGLTLFACHLWAVSYTGAGMNTARSFGPAAVTGFPYPKHWVYWVGPCLGSFLGAGFYSIFKHYRYWSRPDQTTDTEKSPGDPSDTAKSTVGSNTNRADKLSRDEHGDGTNGHIGIDQKLEKERGRPVNDSPV
ncbi:hypothetical protein PILCRDRAFT_779689 [Piloderma croceum F 1598]|uniref:Aquaporin n=1 Tax=Piloderma croceum (strain F 1598) TaxID=765440 RepID=A0A0C3G315_PILCF|nr:hypothetical protein PILCRDRAFT_779689 [Piloderma croceum F 1598]